MASNEPQPVVYAPGQVVNGHVWTGTEWLPVAQPKATSQTSSTLRTLGAILAFVVGALAAVQGLSWLEGFFRLDGDGNPFAGVLGLLGMGAMALAAGFALAGIFLLKK